MSTHRSLNLDTLVLLTSAYFSLGANRFNQASTKFRFFLSISPFSLSFDISLSLRTFRFDQINGELTIVSFDRIQDLFLANKRLNKYE